MADPTAVLGLLWTVATGIYERIGKHRIGHTDLQFQLARYKAYTTVEEKAKLDQGLRHLSCHSTAERLYQLHAAVGKWLASNHFKVKPSGRIDNPHLFPDVRAASFTNIVNTIAQERNELVQELETHAVRLRISKRDILTYAT